MSARNRGRSKPKRKAELEIAREELAFKRRFNAAAEMPFKGPDGRWTYHSVYVKSAEVGRGQGLFAKKCIRTGTAVCPMIGSLRDERFKGVYAFTADGKHVYDGQPDDGNHPGLFAASYANEPEPGKVANCVCSSINTADGNCAMLIAVVDIKVDEELTWCYGNEYKRNYFIGTENPRKRPEGGFIYGEDVKRAGVLCRAVEVPAIWYDPKQMRQFLRDLETGWVLKMHGINGWTGNLQLKAFTEFEHPSWFASVVTDPDESYDRCYYFGEYQFSVWGSRCALFPDDDLHQFEISLEMFVRGAMPLLKHEAAVANMARQICMSKTDHHPLGIEPSIVGIVHSYVTSGRYPAFDKATLEEIH